MKNLQNRKISTAANRRITGQGMTEYIIIVALIAIAAITVVGFFGDTVRAQFGTMASTLGGGTAATSAAAVDTAATAADGEGGQVKDLGTYND